MASAVQWIELASTTLFTLWALYISLVEHPARMSAGAPVALAQWRPSYHRAAPWQASAAAVSLVTGILASIFTGQWAWAFGGLLVGAVIPFTLLVIQPVNRRLDEATISAEDALPLLERWGRLHAARTVLGLLGLIVLLVGAHAR